jgi:hypothetical protein
MTMMILRPVERNLRRRNPQQNPLPENVVHHLRMTMMTMIWTMTMIWMTTILRLVGRSLSPGRNQRRNPQPENVVRRRLTMTTMTTFRFNQ